MRRPGRRCSKSDGSPTGMAGSDWPSKRRRDGEAWRGCADQSGDRMLVLRPLIGEQFELRGAGIAPEPAAVPSPDPVANPRSCRDVMNPSASRSRSKLWRTTADLRVELPQSEIVRRQLRGQHQPRVLEIRLRLLRGGSGTLDFAAYPAEQVGLVVHRGAQSQNRFARRGLIRH